MPETDTLARSLHDVGLAAWFGGSLMGAVGLNGAAAQVDDSKQRARVANAGWAHWTPINLAAIGAHVLGGALIITANKGRIAGQQGVASWTVAKLGVTVAALAATGYALVLGQKMEQFGDVPVEGGTEPLPETPDEVKAAQRQLKLLQWTVPALTGTALVMSARMGEQQRPKEVSGGILGRLLPRS
jgi:hypothetical protein